MGAFLLVEQNFAQSNSANIEIAKKKIEQTNPNCIFKWNDENYALYVYEKAACSAHQFYQDSQGDFCVCVGTMLYADNQNDYNLSNFLTAFDPNTLCRESMYGSYALVIKKGPSLHFFTDYLGTYSVYTCNSVSVWSSCWLAIAELISNKTITTHAVYEYVHEGANHGLNTLYKDISRVDSNYLYALYGKKITRIRKPFDVHIGTDHDVKTIENEIISELERIFTAIKHKFGDNIGTALSGGYDSRLILACLLDISVTPILHVYGHANDPDVIIAKLISHQEKYPLTHTDKNSAPKALLEDFPNIVEQNFYAFDGYSDEGIFNNGLNYETRMKQAREGRLMLNGGGGEIFRNFFYFSSRSMHVQQLVDRIYRRYTFAIHTDCFNSTEYREYMSQNIKNSLNIDRDILSREEIDLAYPLFRCRYWMGKNNSINNRFGFAMTPFMEKKLIGNAARIPIRYKNYGLFQARLINRISPSLASYNSAYGHNFVGKPSFKRRLNENLTTYRPALLRKYAYDIKYYISKFTFPYYLQEEYLSKCINTTFPIMSKYFHIDKIKDTAQFNRICTLEYLFAKTN
jgi:asparagine synthase (glutamine-hydrolysing)